MFLLNSEFKICFFVQAFLCLSLTISLSQKTTIEDTNISSLSELISAYTDRDSIHYLFVDLWGPYCAPCIEAFAERESLVPLFKEKKVLPIYLCIAGDKEASRNRSQEIRNTYPLYGDHYFVSDSMFQDLLLATMEHGNPFAPFSMPYYVLIDLRKQLIFLDVKSYQDFLKLLPLYTVCMEK
jgi:thiol-disulfide isomerase/thioredoxin